MKNTEGFLDRAKSLIRSLLGTPPTEEATSGIATLKGLDGQDYWFGWVSNMWRDRDRRSDPLHGGEIIASEAHKEYVDWLDQNPDQAPEFWCWHELGSARKSRATWWDFSNGFLMMMGPLTPEEAEGLKNAPGPVGMSHGFFGLKDISSGSIVKYRSYEVSDLPRDWAANPWTDLRTLQKEVELMAFNPIKRSYIAKVLGEEKVGELERDTESRAKSLMELGIEFKDSESDQGPPVSIPEPPAADVEAPIEESKGEDITAESPSVETPISDPEVDPAEATMAILRSLVDAVKQLSDNFEALEAQVDSLSTRTKSLQKSDDDRLAELMTPRLAPSVVAGLQRKSASQSPETEVEGDESGGPTLPGQVGVDPSVAWVAQAIPPIRNS